MIIYKLENGSIASLLNVIRNALAHGNIFSCHGGVLLLSMNKSKKINGLIKLSKLNDVCKILEMLKSEVNQKINL